MSSRSATLIVYGVRCPSARARARASRLDDAGLCGVEPAAAAEESVRVPLQRSVASTLFGQRRRHKVPGGVKRRLLRRDEQPKADGHHRRAPAARVYEDVLADARVDGADLRDGRNAGRRVAVPGRGVVATPEPARRTFPPNVRSPPTIDAGPLAPRLVVGREAGEAVGGDAPGPASGSPPRRSRRPAWRCCCGDRAGWCRRRRPTAWAAP